MTGEQFINSLMFDTGKVSVLTTATNYRVIALDWVNRIVRDISTRAAHWKWLEKAATFSTVTDQMSYDLPSDIDKGGLKIITLRQQTSPVKLTYIDQKRFDELEPDPTDSSGDPYLYTYSATALRLWPVPDSIISMYMRYVKSITELNDGDTTSDIPNKYDNIVLDGIKIHAFNFEPEWGDSKAQVLLYEAGVQRMLRDNSSVIDDDQVSEGHSFGQKVLKDPYSFDTTSVGS